MGRPNNILKVLIKNKEQQRKKKSPPACRGPQKYGAMNVYKKKI
jgi:hypothetical protein